MQLSSKIANNHKRLMKISSKLTNKPRKPIKLFKLATHYRRPMKSPSPELAMNH